MKDLIAQMLQIKQLQGRRSAVQSSREEKLKEINLQGTRWQPGPEHMPFFMTWKMTATAGMERDGSAKREEGKELRLLFPQQSLGWKGRRLMRDGKEEEC